MGWANRLPAPAVHDPLMVTRASVSPNLVLGRPFMAAPQTHEGVSLIPGINGHWSWGYLLSFSHLAEPGNNLAVALRLAEALRPASSPDLRRALHEGLECPSDVRPRERRGVQACVQKQPIAEREHYGRKRVGRHRRQLADANALFDPSPEPGAPFANHDRQAIADDFVGQPFRPQIGPDLRMPRAFPSLQHASSESSEPLHSRQIRNLELRQQAVNRCRLLVEQGEEKHLLAVEVGVEGALAQTRLSADLVYPQLCELPTGGTPPGCLDHLLTAPLSNRGRYFGHLLLRSPPSWKPTGRFPSWTIAHRSWHGVRARILL